MLGAPARGKSLCRGGLLAKAVAQGAGRMPGEPTGDARTIVAAREQRAAVGRGRVPASGQLSNAVPIGTPMTPNANAAATPRLSAMPPAAMTGTLTASTSWGINAIMPTTPASFGAVKVPRWPPPGSPAR
jgi:hypothetical protein